MCYTGASILPRGDSLGVTLFSCGGSVDVKSLDAWDMAPAAE